MKMYNFKEIADELNIGREIEFEYNDNEYSINLEPKSLFSKMNIILKTI